MYGIIVYRLYRFRLKAYTYIAQGANSNYSPIYIIEDQPIIIDENLRNKMRQW